tara:strand:+ start:257 stop:733 length:477 start_codon:yes stop_codon:yes gene_type:complete
LINLKKLKKTDLNFCYDLIELDRENYLDLIKIGWNKNGIELQFYKDINYSFGIFENKVLIAFMLGDLISVEKDSEYEILVIYVKKSNRRKGLATKLLRHLEELKKHLNLKKIHLEVSKKNNDAIFFYKRNDFNLMSIRKNYYSEDDQRFDALCYSKLL